MPGGTRLLGDLLLRCTFPPPGTAVTCAFSGGPDSTALLALASAARCDVTAIHVDHQLRRTSAAEADRAELLARTIGVRFRRHTVDVAPGSNLEARARVARAAVLPADVLTGHTADDQAETVLINLLRGAGASGLAAMRPGPTKPLLALRRAETVALCAGLGLDPVIDPSNLDRRFLRNRVREEVLPLLCDVAKRDVVPLLLRTGELLRDDDDLLDELASAIDPSDARAVAAAAAPLARRALRNWLAVDGYVPDLATLNRALDVARGVATACDLGGDRRLLRHRQRLEIVADAARSPNAGQVDSSRNRAAADRASASEPGGDGAGAEGAERAQPPA
jgi:tRNA(Ile)-lysidine synthase